MDQHKNLADLYEKIPLGLSVNEKEILRFIILFEIYRISKGYSNVYVSIDNLYNNLEATTDVIQNRVDDGIQYLIDEFLLERKAFCTISITNNGIKEIENAFINPSFSTYFRQYISTIIDIDKIEYQNIFDIIRYRYLFLKKSYELKESGQVICNCYEVSKLIGIDKETMDRVYFFLMDEEMIEYHATNGTFRLSHKGIKTVEDDIFDYSLIQPKLNSDEYFNLSFKKFANSLHEFNVMAETVFGVKIFKASSKYLSDLIDNCINLDINNKDEKSFIQIILILSSVVDEIYYDRVKKLIPGETKSLKIIGGLFDAKKIKITNEIDNLRLIRELRNNYPPIHNNMPKAAELLSKLSILYPIIDYNDAGKVLVNNFQTSINNLTNLLNKSLS